MASWNSGPDSPFYPASLFLGQVMLRMTVSFLSLQQNTWENQFRGGKIYFLIWTHGLRSFSLWLAGPLLWACEAEHHGREFVVEQSSPHGSQETGGGRGQKQDTPL